MHTDRIENVWGAFDTISAELVPGSGNGLPRDGVFCYSPQTSQDEGRQGGYHGRLGGESGNQRTAGKGAAQVEHGHDGGQINGTRNPHPSAGPFHLDHTAAALLGWAWRLDGSRQHQRDKGRRGWGGGGLLRLPQFTSPPEQ